MTDPIRHLLADIFNCDFASFSDPEEVKTRFFNKKLGLTDLKKTSQSMCGASSAWEGKTIPASLLIKGENPGKPLAIMAQLHGNEPAGLAGILLAMALSEAGMLARDVLAIIGNPLAATQYFEAWEKNPRARQETRDAYRCGLSKDGSLLPDMNRIPADFLKRDAKDPHIRRAQELYALATQSCGILDIHSARGDMVCVTDHKYDRDLKHVSIRAVLVGLADAISAHASAGADRRMTFKTIVSPLPHIEHQAGIEAGRHESPQAPRMAAEFALSFLYGIGWTNVKPLKPAEDTPFEGYHVRPRLTYADLDTQDDLHPDDKIYMASACASLEELPEGASCVIVGKDDGSYGLQTALNHIVAPAGALLYAVRQYEEMEAVKKGQVLAVAVPSGAVFTAPYDFSGIFWSKSAALYDKDPAVGPWPVAAEKLASTKLCYPCEVHELMLDKNS